ncbi:uncharacterized protein ELE39_001027 [Cryptosporidium sp. chipmunk genotype I]|uniref:uncharacterized protein n=1 Tax=Cryptosporidium sp. chipmunk genotype I TaxID=1280935 RepID=UPI003519F882|nr:hypothetical protein ELE39_001027 [Cryptosporidium sp. chipmunk genotype I]
MRRFDVVPITSEFSENPNIIITSLCYVPIIGYIYAGTNFGDILLYRYEDFDGIQKNSGGDALGFNLNKERIVGRERCIRIKNISQKCKRIDKIFPIICYDTVVNDEMENSVRIGGVILCICDGNLFYLDFRLVGKITLLCKGVSSLSVWKDSFNINTFQTKFCIATKKKIIFYNTCLLGDLLDVKDILEYDNEVNSDPATRNKRRSSLENRSSVAKNEKDSTIQNGDTVKGHTSGVNSWFGFSTNNFHSNSGSNGNNSSADYSLEASAKNEKYLKNDYLSSIEFIKVDEIQIPSRLASFNESICNIEWCDSWVCFVIANTYFIMNIDDQSISDILNLDQLGNNFQPQIIILPEQEFMLTCQDNLGAFFSFSTLEPSPKSMIQWPSEGLTGVVLSSPYLLGGTKNGIIQIYSLASYETNSLIKESNAGTKASNFKSGNELLSVGTGNKRGFSNNNSHNSVQTLQLDDEITCISTGGTCEAIFFSSSSVMTAPLGPMVVVSTKTKIYALTPIPIEESIFELVNRNQGKQALNMLRTYCNSNDLLFNSLLYKTQCLVGWYEFKNLQFEKAFQSFKQAHIDPRVLIILFWKDLIPIEWDLKYSNGSLVDLYEYAKLPWTNSKGNLSEDLSPDVKFHESLLKSVLRKKALNKLPPSIDLFVQSLLLNKSDLHSNLQINLEGGLERIDEYIYFANRSLKMFLLSEREKYTSNIENSKDPFHQVGEQGEEQKSYSTGKIMDIAIIKLIINEFNSKHKRIQDISLSNRIILNLLKIDSEQKTINKNNEDDSVQQEDMMESEIEDECELIIKRVIGNVFSEFSIDEYEEFLLSNGRYDILAILLAYNSSYLRSLEILENMVNSSDKNTLELYSDRNSNYINIYLIIYQVLLHLCSSEITPIHIQANLLKRYSRFILDKFEICPIDRLFTLKPVDKFPLTIDEILGLFNLLPTMTSNHLTKSYLERIIATQGGNIELKHKINLIEIYINDVSTNNEVGIDPLITDRSSYTNLFNESFKPSKLAIMLEDLEDFDAEILVKHISYGDHFKYKVHDNIIIEYLIVLFRSNRHFQALNYIINVLESIELAEIYTLAWIYHNKYALQSTSASIKGALAEKPEFEISFQNDQQNNLVKNIRQKYHKLKLFTEFKLWRIFVDEYSDISSPLQQNSTGYLEMNSWLEILDISHNELSLISEEYTKGKDLNEQSNYMKLMNKLTSLNGNMNLQNIYSHSTMDSNGELIALVRILIESWSSCIQDKSTNKAKKLQNSTINILNKYSFHPDISIGNILQIIPGEWPLLNMMNFLKNSLVSSIHNQTSKSISTNLSAISFLRLYEKWSNTRSNHVTITQDMICHVCSLKLGNKPCALYPNGSCVHTHCLFQ